jgi:hypothetical protein
MSVLPGRWFGLIVGACAVGGCGDESGSGPCAGVDCSGHGICFVASGVAYCECARGYHAEGLVCLPGDPPDVCRGVLCSGHGSCVVTASGAASCDCATGYVPHGLDCVPSACPLVWRHSLPGIQLLGLTFDPVGGSILIAGNMGTAAVVVQLDACGELVRQQPFSGPPDTWSAASRIVIDGDTLHAFGSYEPWDPFLTPTESGALHARLTRSPLGLLDVRQLSLGANWVRAWYYAVARGADGSWWIGGSQGLDDPELGWVPQARLLREDPDGSYCVGLASSETGTWVESVASIDGRIWVGGVLPRSSYLRSYAPEGDPAAASCVGDPVQEWELRPTGLNWFFPTQQLPFGEGSLLVGEGGNVIGGSAVRLRWSEADGWTAPPTQWNPTDGYDRFHGAVRGPDGELCAFGVGDYANEEVEAYDGLLACYQPGTLEPIFEQRWPALGGCTGLAVDAEGGLIVGCAGWVDGTVMRCLPTGECPAP